MNELEREFLQLRERYQKADEYFKTKYQTDTPEGQEWAGEEFRKIVERMSLVWRQMTPEFKKEYAEQLFG